MTLHGQHYTGYIFNDYFLDIVGGWINNPRADMYEGTRRGTEPRDPCDTRVMDRFGDVIRSEPWCPTVALLDRWAAHDWTNGIQLDRGDLDLAPLYVRTRNTLYEIVVLSGRTRDVLVRGGRFFPERTRAVLAGSSLGGSFLKMGGIYVGFRMELHHLRQRIVTSPIVSIGLVTGTGAEPVARTAAPTCH